MFWCGYYLRAATIQKWHSFLWKVHRHQWWLDNVHTSDTVMIARAVSSKHSSQSCCLPWNKSYHTNSPSTSLIILVRNYSHMVLVQHIVAAANTWGQCLFAQSSSLCAYYSKVVSIWRNTVHCKNTWITLTTFRLSQLHQCDQEMLLNRFYWKFIEELLL